MDNGKYIVLNGKNIIIFDPTLSHKEVAAGFLHDKITSAGFIVTSVDPHNKDEVLVQCFGRSVTLSIPSDQETDERLARFAIGKY